MESFINRGILSTATDAGGSVWAQLSTTALPCNQITVYNETGTALRWRYCTLDGSAIGAGASLPIADGVAQPIRGISDARQVQVKRGDDSPTQVDVGFLYEGN